RARKSTSSRSAGCPGCAGAPPFEVPLSAASLMPVKRRRRSGFGGRGRALALPLQQLAHGLARHRAVLDPVLQALLVDAELDRVAQRVVDAQLLDEAAVARAAPVRRNDAVERNLLAACAGQSDFDGHLLMISLKAGSRT